MKNRCLRHIHRLTIGFAEVSHVVVSHLYNLIALSLSATRDGATAAEGASGHAVVLFSLSPEWTPHALWTMAAFVKVFGCPNYRGFPPRFSMILVAGRTMLTIRLRFIAQLLAVQRANMFMTRQVGRLAYVLQKVRDCSNGK